MRRRLLIGLLLVALLVPLLYWRAVCWMWMGQPDVDQSLGLGVHVGEVRDGLFYSIAGCGEPVIGASLTQIAMQEARSPESAAIPLDVYEGHVVQVTGHDGGGWVYSACVLRSARASSWFVGMLRHCESCDQSSR